MKYLFLWCTLFCSTLFASYNEASIKCYLACHDFIGGKEYLETHYEQEKHNPAYIRNLLLMYAKLKLFSHIESTLAHYINLKQDLTVDTELLEEIAWAKLSQTTQSQNSELRFLSFLLAAQTNSNQGASLLKQAFIDQNIPIQQLAYEQAAYLRDDFFIRGLSISDIVSLPYSIRVPTLLLYIQHFSLSPDMLDKLIKKGELHTEEYLSLLSAYADKYSLSHSTIRLLSSSKSSMLKILALICLYQSQDIALSQELYHLLQDQHEDVRIIAMQIFGLMCPEKITLPKEPLLIKERLIWHWLKIRQNPTICTDKDYSLFIETLEHSNDDISALSAFLITFSSKTGLQTAQDIFTKNYNSYIKQNIALRFIQEECASPIHIKYIFDHLLNFPSIQKSCGLFWYIGKTHTLKESFNLTAAVQLSYLVPERASSILTYFFRQSPLSFRTHIAHALVQLTNEQFEKKLIDIVRKEQFQQAYEAALLAKLFFQNQEATQYLQYQFEQAPYHMQEIALMLHSEFHDRTNISFLLQKIFYPHEKIGLFAAYALIQTLMK